MSAGQCPTCIHGTMASRQALSTASCFRCASTACATPARSASKARRRLASYDTQVGVHAHLRSASTAAPKKKSSDSQHWQREACARPCTPHPAHLV